MFYGNVYRKNCLFMLYICFVYFFLVLGIFELVFNEKWVDEFLIIAKEFMGFDWLGEFLD